MICSQCVLLLVLQLVVLDVGSISLTVLPLCRFEEVRESLSLVIIFLIFFPFLAIILLFAFFIVILLLVILQDGGCSNNLELIEPPIDPTRQRARYTRNDSSTASG